MTTPLSRRRRCRIVLCLISLIVAAQALLGAPATALPNWVTGCTNAPEPQRPGAGWVGQLDPPLDSRGVSGSVYNTYSYAGQVWRTYGDGCEFHPYATATTTGGSIMFDIAKSTIGMTNAIYYYDKNGEGFSALDEFIADWTLNLYDGIYTPWLALILVIASVIMFRAVFAGDLAALSKRVLYMMAAFWLATATYLSPMLYINAVEHTFDAITDDVENKMFTAVNVNPHDGIPELLHDQVVYRSWLAGEFGSADSPLAQQLGRQLLEAQACEKSRPCDSEAKKTRFNQTLEKMGAVKETFEGTDGARLGAGFGAMVKAMVFAPFQAVARLGTYLVKFLFRMIVLAGSVLGLIAILHNELLPRVVRGLAGAFGNGLVLVVAAVLHALMLAWILHPNRNLELLPQLFIITGVTMVLWALVSPVRRLLMMIGGVLQALGVKRMPFQGMARHLPMLLLLAGARRRRKHQDTSKEQDDWHRVRGRGSWGWPFGRRGTRGGPHGPEEPGGGSFDGGGGGLIRSEAQDAPPRADIVPATAGPLDRTAPQTENERIWAHAERITPPAVGSRPRPARPAAPTPAVALEPRRKGGAPVLERGEPAPPEATVEATAPRELTAGEATSAAQPSQRPPRPREQPPAQADPELFIPSRDRKHGRDETQGHRRAEAEDPPGPREAVEPTPAGDGVIYEIYTPSTGEVFDSQDGS